MKSGEKISKQFLQHVQQETERNWEQWLVIMQEDCGATYTTAQLVDYLQDVHKLSDKWAVHVTSMYEQLLGRKQIGLTADAGWQIGVVKTASFDIATAWNILLSPAGLNLWLGELSSLPLEIGAAYSTSEGLIGEIRSIKPMEKLRLTWKPADWEHSSTLQIYLLAAKHNRTTLRFHQEKLDDPYMREIMRLHWGEVADRLIELFVAEQSMTP